MLTPHTKSPSFPNRAGNAPTNDQDLALELEAAGIEVCRLPSNIKVPNSEVVTSIIGSLHGWHFERAWRYWVCKGPGIDVETAEKLHVTHGQTVRVDGHCGCPSPRQWFKGFACGNYHVDDAAGLKALADTIKQVVKGPAHVETHGSVGLRVFCMTCERERSIFADGKVIRCPYCHSGLGHIGLGYEEPLPETKVVPTLQTIFDRLEKAGPWISAALSDPAICQSGIEAFNGALQAISELEQYAAIHPTESRLTREQLRAAVESAKLTYGPALKALGHNKETP